jgi:hypothetical protein
VRREAENRVTIYCWDERRGVALAGSKSKWWPYIQTLRACELGDTVSKELRGTSGAAMLGCAQPPFSVKCHFQTGPQST